MDILIDFAERMQIEIWSALGWIDNWLDDAGSATKITIAISILTLIYTARSYYHSKADSSSFEKKYKSLKDQLNLNYAGIYKKLADHEVTKNTEKYSSKSRENDLFKIEKNEEYIEITNLSDNPVYEVTIRPGCHHIAQSHVNEFDDNFFGSGPDQKKKVNPGEKIRYYYSSNLRSMILAEQDILIPGVLIEWEDLLGRKYSQSESITEFMS